MKHYVLLHRQPDAPTAVEGVYHEPSAPILRARAGATSRCRNMDFYEERVADAGDFFRAVYGPAGECFALVESQPQVDTVPSQRSPEAWRGWIFDLLNSQLDGEWEMVSALVERDDIIVENPGSPFQGKTPGENIFYSLHLRMNEAARALLKMSDTDRARIKTILEDDGE